MELNIESQKQEFLTICRSCIQREGVEDLLGWLEKADFFYGASQYALPRGLCRRAVSAQY